MEFRKKMGHVLAAALSVSVMATAAAAEIRIGVLLSTTGPNASIGIPYNNMLTVVPDTFGGESFRLIHLNDASDPSTSVRNARKVINEDKVDIIIGGSSSPAALAIAEVAEETQTPFLALSAVNQQVKGMDWVFVVPHAVDTMLTPVVNDMKAEGVTRVGYIGYSDAWGDIVLGAFQAITEGTGISVVAEERFARADTSVAGQVLKLVAARPDAVLVGASGVAAALPNVTLVERGFKGPIFHTHATIIPEFLRVGGAKVEGAIAPSGPFVVGEQLPEDHPLKATAAAAAALYEAAFGAGSKNAFAGYSYDAFVLAATAAVKAAETAEPGTGAYRAAVRAAIENSGDEVIGATAIYAMTPEDHTGVDERSVVLVQVTDGAFKLKP
ncbi:ABC transporter substrate-binding protein [Salipiger sp. P9]|uniref:ABC transporter substrate-binding protein n=1 Tax=Salipiger pentaromativorans TaxID=2943193 RepID=UPI0021581118|nr:ABC transporter substrate-binding protein [Salipiger pentaromativorans]MCR8547580.1 ABC transporter substrate-binding protein [Salipiger pentaromativorans]